MALRGGYKIIDLKGKPLTPMVGMVYEGIYDSIEETQKPILLSGLVIDDEETLGGIVEFNDLYVNTISAETNYVIRIGLAPNLTIVLMISDLDVVTVQLLQI